MRHLNFATVAVGDNFFRMNALQIVTKLKLLPRKIQNLERTIKLKSSLWDKMELFPNGSNLILLAFSTTISKPIWKQLIMPRLVSKQK